jgi:hypothetical protein
MTGETRLRRPCVAGVLVSVFGRTLSRCSIHSASPRPPTPVTRANLTPTA